MGVVTTAIATHVAVDGLEWASVRPHVREAFAVEGWGARRGDSGGGNGGSRGAVERSTRVSFRAKRLAWPAVLSIGVFQALSLGLGNACYLYLDVSFVQMLKAFSPVSVMLLLSAIGVEAPSRASALSVAVISAGTCLTAWTAPRGGDDDDDDGSSAERAKAAAELTTSAEFQGSSSSSLNSFSSASSFWIGLGYAAGAEAAEGGRLVLTQQLLGSPAGLTAVEGQYFVGPVCASAMLALSLASGELSALVAPTAAALAAPPGSASRSTTRSGNRGGGGVEGGGNGGLLGLPGWVAEKSTGLLRRLWSALGLPGVANAWDGDWGKHGPRRPEPADAETPTTETPTTEGGTASVGMGADARANARADARADTAAGGSGSKRDGEGAGGVQGGSPSSASLMPVAVGLLILACGLGLGVNYLGFFVIREVGSVSLKALGVARNVGLVVAAVSIWGERVAPLEAAGYALSLIGFAAYTALKATEASTAAAAAEQGRPPSANPAAFLLGVESKRVHSNAIEIAVGDPG